MSTTYKKLEQSTKNLLDNEKDPAKLLIRAIRLINEYSKPKNTENYDILVGCFKRFVDNAVPIDQDNDTVVTLVKKAFTFKSKDRISYALELLMKNYQKESCQELLFTLITKYYKDTPEEKLLKLLNDIKDSDVIGVAKIALAIFVVATKRSPQKTIMHFLQQPASQDSQNSQNTDKEDIIALLNILKNSRKDFIEVLQFADEHPSKKFLTVTQNWLLDPENKALSRRIVLHICTTLTANKIMDQITLPIFFGALRGRYLDQDEHSDTHKLFEQACEELNENRLPSELRQKIESYSEYRDENSDSSESEDFDEPDSTVSTTLRESKQRIVDLQDKIIKGDDTAAKELLTLVMDYWDSKDYRKFLAFPEACISLASVLSKQLKIVDCRKSPDDLLNKAKNALESFAARKQKTREREGLFCDMAQLYYDGVVYEKNEFMARYLLELCNESKKGNSKLTEQGKILLASMYFNAEGGLEDLDGAQKLLEAVPKEIINKNKDTLYMLAEIYFVKQFLELPSSDPKKYWQQAAELGHEKAGVTIQVFEQYGQFSIQTLKEDVVNHEDGKDDPSQFEVAQPSDDIPTPMELSSGNVSDSDSDLAGDDEYRGAHGTTTADTDLTNSIINLLIKTTLDKLNKIVDKLSEADLDQPSKKKNKPGTPQKKNPKKEHTQFKDELDIIIDDYAKIVSDYKPKVRSAKIRLGDAAADYEALVHHAAKGELFKHLRSSRVTYQVAQVRGVHCFNHLWTDKQVKIFNNLVRDKDHPLKQLPVYSAAVFELAGVNMDTQLVDNKFVQLRLEQAARLLRYQMQNMKKAPYIDDPTIKKTVNRKHKDRLLQAQQFYTEYYTKFKEVYLPAAHKEPKHESLVTSGVPFISTGDVQSIHGARYAAGDKVYGFGEKNKRSPEYDQNLRPKNRYVGFIYLTIHPVSDYHPSTHHHIPSLVQDNILSVKFHILFERENTFFSDIAAGKVRYITTFKFPSFAHKPLKLMDHKYGLNTQLTNAFKNALEKTKDCALKRKLVVALLAEHMAAYHSMYLHHRARVKITEVNEIKEPAKAIMLYRTQHGGFSNKNTSFTNPKPKGNEDHNRRKRVTHRLDSLKWGFNHAQGFKTEDSASAGNTDQPSKHQHTVKVEGIDICTAYWYEDNEMKKILYFALEKYLVDEQDTPMVYGPLDNLSQLGLYETLLEHNRKKGTLLIPYNIGNRHWVGLVLAYDNGGRLVKADFFDSLNGKIPKALNWALLSLSKDNDPVTEFKEITEGIFTQSNGSDCGSCCIDNLCSSVGCELPENEQSAQRRHRHLTLLAQDEKFYPDFYERQRKNRPSFVQSILNSPDFIDIKNYQPSQNEYKKLVLLANDIVKLPNNDALVDALVKVFSPQDETLPSSEHADKLVFIRSALDNNLDDAAFSITKRLFCVLSQKDNVMEASLKLDYNALTCVCNLVSLGKSGLQTELFSINKQSSESHYSQADLVSSVGSVVRKQSLSSSGKHKISNTQDNSKTANKN